MAPDYWLPALSALKPAVDVVWRPASRRNLVLIGDAALAFDPVMAVGCGWALQSAEWLADAVEGAIWYPRELERGLARYRVRHRNTLLPHHFLNCSYSTGASTRSSV